MHKAISRGKWGRTILTVLKNMLAWYVRSDDHDVVWIFKTNFVPCFKGGKQQIREMGTEKDIITVARNPRTRIFSSVFHLCAFVDSDNLENH